MTSIPPGWYVDPEDESQLRYWNGSTWQALTRGRDDSPASDAQSEMLPPYEVGKISAPSPSAVEAQSSSRKRAWIAALAVALGLSLVVGMLLTSGQDDQPSDSSPESQSADATPAEAMPGLGADQQLLLDPSAWGPGCYPRPARSTVRLSPAKAEEDLLGDGTMDVVAAATCATGQRVEVRAFDGATGSSLRLFESGDLVPSATSVQAIRVIDDEVSILGRYVVGKECSECALGRFEEVVAVRDGSVSQLSSDTWVKGLRGAAGYGNVKLGMPLPILRQLEEVTSSQPGASGAACDYYGLRSGGTALVSSRDGRVRMIGFSPQMATAEGLRPGATAAELVEAYPTVRPGDRGLREYRLSSDVAYYFLLRDGVVIRIWLSLVQDSCLP